MNTRRIIGIISLIILVLSLAALVYSFVPSPLKVDRQNISPQEMELPQRNALPVLLMGVIDATTRKRKRAMRALPLIFVCSILLGACATPTTEAPKPTQAPQPTSAAAPTSAPAATSAPKPTTVQPTQSSAATPTKEPQGGGGVTVRPPESRVIELQYPARIYLGDTPSITLTLVVSPDGTYITPTAKASGGQVVSDPIKIENLYETHNVTASATFESAGFKIDHAGAWEQPMTQGQNVKWIWTVNAESEGVKTFKILLQLRYVPKLSGETLNKPLWVRDFDVEVSKYIFLPLGVARMVGVIGFVGGGIGTVLGFPFAKEIVTWLWEKIRGKPAKKKKGEKGKG
ncbi:MAG: hypothetical protein HY740_00520 [Chloroflexi bacterium]|nr:hypothetical protein [Chloroflexota bacterium]